MGWHGEQTWTSHHMAERGGFEKTKEAQSVGESVLTAGVERREGEVTIFLSYSEKQADLGATCPYKLLH